MFLSVFSSSSRMADKSSGSTGNCVKQRSLNFTMSEKFLITDIVEDFSGVVENKCTDGKSTKEKDNAWAEVTTIFNSRSAGCIRKTCQLQNLWKNLKQKTKKDYAKQRMHAARTGGGPPPPEMDELAQKVFSIIPSQIEPLSNPYDDDVEVDVGTYRDGGLATIDLIPVADPDIASDSTVHLSVPIPASLTHHGIALDSGEGSSHHRLITNLYSSYSSNSEESTNTSRSRQVRRSKDCPNPQNVSTQLLQMNQEEHTKKMKLLELKVENEELKKIKIKRKMDFDEEIHLLNKRKISET